MVLVDRPNPAGIASSAAVRVPPSIPVSDPPATMCGGAASSTCHAGPMGDGGCFAAQCQAQNHRLVPGDQPSKVLALAKLICPTKAL